MLNADSSTLKKESDVQRSATPPIAPSVAASFRTALTSSTIRLIGTPGSVFRISSTRKLDSSARPVSPSSESARKVKGTNESNAKYAIIAARCVPRSAKNFSTRRRFRLRTRRSIPVRLSRMDAAQAIADLTEVSSQIQTVALFDRSGKVAASNLGDDAAAERFARAAL